MSYTIPPDPHAFYSLHIYNTYIVLTTNKPRIFTVVILLRLILLQQYGRTLRLRHLQTQRCVQLIGIHNNNILFIAPKPYTGYNKVIVYYIPSIH